MKLKATVVPQLYIAFDKSLLYRLLLRDRRIVWQSKQVHHRYEQLHDIQPRTLELRDGQGLLDAGVYGTKRLFPCQTKAATARDLKLGKSRKKVQKGESRRKQVQKGENNRNQTKKGENKLKRENNQ